MVNVPNLDIVGPAREAVGAGIPTTAGGTGVNVMTGRYDNFY